MWSRRTPLRTGLNKAGKRPFGAAYAKHVGERQHVVGLFLATLEAGGDANRFDRRHALATNSGRAAVALARRPDATAGPSIGRLASA